MSISQSLLTLSLALTLVVASASIDPSTARASSPEDQASALVEEGLTHARSGNFSRAAELFAAAVKLHPDPTILHSLARAREEMGHHAQAFETFAKALDLDPNYLYADDARERMAFLEGLLKTTHARLKITSVPQGSEIALHSESGPLVEHVTTPFRTWAPAGTLRLSAQRDGYRDGALSLTVEAGESRDVEMILQRVARKGILVLVSSVPGAQVFVDGELRGVTPVEPMSLEEGSHAIRLMAEGRPPVELIALVQADNETRLMARFESAARPISALGPTLMGAGAVAAIGGIAMHVFAFEAAEAANKKYAQVELHNELNEGVAAAEASDEARALESDAKLDEAIAYVGYGLAAALVGAGTWVMVSERSDKSASGAQDLAETQSHWAPWVRPTGNGLFAGARMSF